LDKNRLEGKVQLSERGGKKRSRKKENANCIKRERKTAIEGASGSRTTQGQRGGHSGENDWKEGESQEPM